MWLIIHNLEYTQKIIFRAVVFNAQTVFLEISAGFSSYGNCKCRLFSIGLTASCYSFFQSKVELIRNHNLYLLKFITYFILTLNACLQFLLIQLIKLLKFPTGHKMHQICSTFLWHGHSMWHIYLLHRYQTENGLFVFLRKLTFLQILKNLFAKRTNIFISYYE
jgi:hypothetical protein